MIEKPGVKAAYFSCDGIEFDSFNKCIKHELKNGIASFQLFKNDNVCSCPYSADKVIIPTPAALKSANKYLGTNLLKCGTYTRSEYEGWVFCH